MRGTVFGRVLSVDGACGVNVPTRMLYIVEVNGKAQSIGYKTAAENLQGIEINETNLRCAKIKILKHYS